MYLQIDFGWENGHRRPIMAHILERTIYLVFLKIRYRRMIGALTEWVQIELFDRFFKILLALVQSYKIILQRPPRGI